MRRCPRAALVIFARHPQRGRVKTRLVPPLTPEEALGLHMACLESTVRLAASLPPSVDKWLYLSSPDLAAARRATRTLGLTGRIRVRVQRGRDLGARLQRAYTELRAQGYERIVFIGSDSPTLPPRRLQHAFAALSRVDAVIGPARDGGYYLIGARSIPGGLPEMFRGIDWGTSRAFRQTLARLRQAGRRTKVLPLGYDVDTGADLRRLRRDVRSSARCPHLAPLRAWFSRWPRKPTG